VLFLLVGSFTEYRTLRENLYSITSCHSLTMVMSQLKKYRTLRENLD
jgi:hypothetical protein